jgi:hypothetical protein
MNIAQILRSSLPVVLVHLTSFGQSQASDSLPSIDSIYSSGRNAGKEGISSIQPVAKSTPEVIRPLPPVVRPVAVKPTPAVRKNAPEPIKPATVVVVPPVSKPVAAKQKPTVAAEKAAPKPVVKPEALAATKTPVKPKASAPTVQAPRKMAEYGPIISETLPVIGAGPADEPASPVVNVTKPKIAVEAKVSKPKAAPKVASPDSLNNPAVAKQIDPSKLSIFGPQAMSFRYDPRMIRAMEIASARAYARSQGTCWRYVKNALLSAGLVDTRPTTAYAKEAAQELTSKYGFRKISCSNPYEAPLGSVLVYGGAGAGHVEFRTRGGFVSDFTTPRPSKRPLIGVYVK